MIGENKVWFLFKKRKKNNFGGRAVCVRELLPACMVHPISLQLQAVAVAARYPEYHVFLLPLSHIPTYVERSGAAAQSKAEQSRVQLHKR